MLTLKICCVCRWFLVPKLVGFPFVGPTTCLSVQTTCCSCHPILVYLGLSATVPTSLGSATQLVKGRQGSYLETAAKVGGLRFRKSFDLGICHHPPIHLHVDAGGKNIHGAIWKKIIPLQNHIKIAWAEYRFQWVQCLKRPDRIRHLATPGKVRKIWRSQI